MTVLRVWRRARENFRQVAVCDTAAAQPQWSEKLTPRDLRALTPLIWEHVNPYGRFELDMEARLPIN